MCLIVLANNVHPKYKFVFAANRDEFYNRPTEQAKFWDDNPNLLAGKDVKAGGTWLGITKNGRFAAITNYRDMKSIKEDAPSRGKITIDYLLSNSSPEDFYNSIKSKMSNYNGFNFICGSLDELYYFSNKKEELRKIDNGIHGLSNSLLDTPWLKVEKSKEKLKNLLANEEVHPWEVLSILSDTTLAKDDELPDTGIGLEWERILSSVFIKSDNYGTRCSTVIMVDYDDNVVFVEKTYFANFGTFSTKDFKFKINKEH